MAPEQEGRGKIGAARIDMETFIAMREKMVALEVESRNQTKEIARLRDAVEKLDNTIRDSQREMGRIEFKMIAVIGTIASVAGAISAIVIKMFTGKP